MTHGKGIAAVRARIEEQFRQVHHDQRTKEQIAASEEMAKALAEPAVEEPQIEIIEPEAQVKQAYTEESAAAFERKAQALVTVACNVDLPRLRNTTQHCWWAGDADEQVDLEKLFADALKSLEKKS
jgi:hypothetical protein